MKQKRTNKEVLAKGIKILAIALGAIFLGPVIVYNAFMNKEHLAFPFVLGIGICILLLAIFLILKGVQTILNSFFN